LTTVIGLRVSSLGFSITGFGLGGTTGLGTGGCGFGCGGITTGLGAGGGTKFARLREIFCDLPDGGGTLIFGNFTKSRKKIRRCNSSESKIAMSVLVLIVLSSA